METDQLQHIIEDIQLLPQADSSMLRDWTERYPWYPVPWVLLAKLQHHQQDPAYPETLARAAMLVPDREVLFQLIERTPIQEILEESVIDINERIQDETPVATEEVEPETIGEDTSEEEPVFEYVPYELEMQQAIMELERNGEAATLPDLPSVEEFKVGQEDDVQQHTFSEWLSLVEGAERISLVNRSVARSPIRIHPDRSFRDEPTPEESSEEQEDDFDEWQAKELARQSSELNDEALSETLAAILVSQGKTDRAIWIYEKLGLKYPEKMAYFAGLIEDLKKEH